MAGHIGKIGEFDPGLEEWSSYLERLNHYFAANGVANDKKRDTFLCCIGRETFSLLRALVAPEKPGDKTYQELCDALTAHLAPKPLVIAERFRFHKRVQKEGESIKVYAASLQKLAEHCNFGNGLSDTLRDRLVCGMKDEKVQQRLLTMADLTFKKAVEEAEMAERASKYAAEFHDGVIPEVHQLPKSTSKCYRCDGYHEPQSCRFLKEQCKYCKKWGHIERACRTKKRSQNNPRKTQPAVVKKLEEGARPVEEDLEDETVLNWGGVYTIEDWKDNKPMLIETTIEGKVVEMELDTGAAVSLIPHEMYQKKFAHVPLGKTRTLLKTYTGEKVHPRGVAYVKVKKGTEMILLPLLVVDSTGPPLLGRNWLTKIPIDWKSVRSLACNNLEESLMQQRLENLLAKYPGIMKDTLGRVTDIKAKLRLKDGSTPIFMKARPVPYNLRTKVEAELERLEQEGIITPVPWSDWATPVMVVPKPDGSVRLCGDFKTAVNPALNVDQFPLPRVEDILATLGGSDVFSKIDLRWAYLQMELEEESKVLATINTHKGLYRYNRLAFGIASAPAIWQKTIERVLEGIPKTQCLLDDIIVAGTGEEEHLKLLEQVLERLQRYNLTINKNKCTFLQKEVVYCGYRVNGEGLHKMPEKVRSITEAPAPTNVSQLRAFLGMVNYYHRFLPDLATTLAPLHELLKKHVKWVWSKECETAFNLVKQLMASKTVLTHFNPSLPLILSCDASPYAWARYCHTR